MGYNAYRAILSVRAVFDTAFNQEHKIPDNGRRYICPIRDEVRLETVVGLPLVPRLNLLGSLGHVRCILPPEM